MNLNWLDLTVIFLYIAAIIDIGIFISRKASHTVGPYFIVSNGIPVEVQGGSNA